MELTERYIFLNWSYLSIRASPYSTTWRRTIDRLCTEYPTARSHNLSSYVDKRTRL
ncbi:hypothetical protein QUB30_16510 [Microcoleus sp. BROC3]